MNAVLELADVTVKRGGATLLDGVDWEVEEDERWVILGPNGAGKTTLMQLCSAQIHPTSGVVGILGEVVGTVDVFELRPRIGWTSAAVGLDLGGREDLVSTLSAIALDEFSPATILVSHHVEEIPPGFTHALMLREGRVVAAGPLPHVMNAEQLSATFGMRLTLHVVDGRYSARRVTRRHA